MSKKIADISFVDLLPPSIAKDDKILAAATALDIELQLLNTELSVALIFSRIDDLAEDILDLLAWQLHIDSWPPDLTLAMKRDKIKNALLDHRYKGTVWAVENGVKGLGYTNVEIYESVAHWAEFDVDVDMVDGGLLAPDIIKTINENKNRRSHLRDMILTSKPASAPLGAGVAMVTHIQC